MSTIKRIIIHCSDTPDGDPRFTAADIKRWHTDPPPRGRGWRDIGYHYVVEVDGSVSAGRKQNGDSILEGKEIGAHTKGFNADSLGICMVGRKHFSQAQWDSLADMCAQMLYALNLDETAVFGHRQFDSGKDCPGFDVPSVLRPLVSAQLDLLLKAKGNKPKKGK